MVYKYMVIYYIYNIRYITWSIINKLTLNELCIYIYMHNLYKN